MPPTKEVERMADDDDAFRCSEFFKLPFFGGGGGGGLGSSPSSASGKPLMSPSPVGPTASCNHDDDERHRQLSPSPSTDSRVFDESRSQPAVSGRSMCGPLPWRFLPLLAGVVPIIGLAITYAIAKTNCHVEKWIFPYVSYTGTRFPELMYFSLLLNLEGFFGMVIVFLAWRYYRYLSSSCQVLKVNNFTLLVGSVSCFGVIMVANFPVTYSKVPHYVGAALAFILGTAYTLLTAVLSNKTAPNSPLKYRHRIKNVRAVLAAVMTVSLLSLIGFAIFKSNQEETSKKLIDEKRYLTRLANGSCPFYPNSNRRVDLFGSVVEWILTMGILVCLSLYSYEFKTFDAVKIVLKSKSTSSMMTHTSTSSPSNQQAPECLACRHHVITNNNNNIPLDPAPKQAAPKRHLGEKDAVAGGEMVV